MTINYDKYLNLNFNLNLDTGIDKEPVNNY